MTIAVYPATFDPVHNGHIDIAMRAARIFDQVIVAVFARPSKSLMFSVDERVWLLQETFKGAGNVRVAAYSTLTSDFAHVNGAQVIIRGLRDVNDFELEFKQALMYRHLRPELEVVNLISDSDYTYVSSSLLKEVAMLGGDVDRLVPPHVARALYAKLKQMGIEAEQKVKMVALSND